MIRKADVTASPARNLIGWFVGMMGRHIFGVRNIIVIFIKEQDCKHESLF